MATPAQRARRRRARARRAKNKNKGGGQPTQGVQKFNNNSKRGPRAMTSAALREQACAFWNPFCSPVGIKWPDENSGRTVAWRERFRGELVVNADQYHGAAYFFPRLTSPIYLAPTLGTGGIWPVASLGTADEWPDMLGFGLDAKAYRIVNFGVRVRYVGPALYARGLLTFATMEGDTTSEYPGDPAVYATEKEIFAITPGMDVCWCARPLSANAREFLADSVTSALSSWSSLALFFTGLDTNTLTSLHVEVVAHMEILPKPGGNLIHAATPAAPANYSFMQSVANVVRDLPSTVENFGQAMNSARTLAGMFASGSSLPMLTL